jgi:hypothetical protein
MGSGLRRGRSRSGDVEGLGFLEVGEGVEIEEFVGVFGGDGEAGDVGEGGEGVEGTAVFAEHFLEGGKEGGGVDCEEGFGAGGGSGDGGEGSRVVGGEEFLQELCGEEGGITGKQEGGGVRVGKGGEEAKEGAVAFIFNFRFSIFD